MLDAAANWWSVVMNIYAQAGLTVMTLQASGRLPGPIVPFVPVYLVFLYVY